jgi:hypothetical protein
MNDSDRRQLKAEFAELARKLDGFASRIFSHLDRLRAEAALGEADAVIASLAESIPANTPAAATD